MRALNRDILLPGLILAASLALVSRAPADPAAPASTQLAQADDAKADLDYWNSIKNSKSAADYQGYLDKFPNGNFADLAKLRVKQYAAAPAPAPAPATAPADPEKAELDDWNKIKESKQASDYQAFLQKYPHGNFADLAKLRIQQYAAAAQPAPAPAPTPTPAPAAAPAMPSFVSVDTKLYAKVSGARVHAGPEVGAAVISNVALNTPLGATGKTEDGNWWRVTLADGRTGYIANSIVSAQPVAVAPAAPKAQASAPAAVAAPTGPDSEVCKASSAAAPQYRVSACERQAAAAQSDDDKFAALRNLGTALDLAQRYDDAVRKLEQAASLKPRDASTYFQIGMVRLDELQFPEAHNAFEKAASLDSKNPDIMFERGVAYLGIGDLERARLDVKRALLTKDDARYYEKWAQVELAAGDLAAMKTALERGRKADPGRHSLILAAANYYAGAFDQAASDAAGVTGDPPAGLWMALIKRAEGDAAGATQALETARGAVGDAWPAPVYDALDGKISADKARAAARSSDANRQFQQNCQLDFFLGEWAYLGGDKNAARSALQAATGTRAYYLLEYAAAKARLANM